MIHDHLSHATDYAFANRLLQKGMNFLHSPETSVMAVGRLELDGDRLFAICQEYRTKPGCDCFWEAHKRYIDIQYISAGVEDIGYAPLAGMKIIEPYDSTRDFMKLTGDGSILKLAAGMFAVFFPQDAHMPCLSPAGVAGIVRKIVVKVMVDP